MKEVIIQELYPACFLNLQSEDAVNKAVMALSFLPRHQESIGAVLDHLSTGTTNPPSTTPQDTHAPPAHDLGSLTKCKQTEMLPVTDLLFLSALYYFKDSWDSIYFSNLRFFGL